MDPVSWQYTRSRSFLILRGAALFFGGLCSAKILYRGIKGEKSSWDLGSCRWRLGVAFCTSMSTRIAWLRFISVLLLLLRDAVRFLLLGTRSRAALKAENLFLRKQLVLYLERKAKPRRAHDATRLTLALLSTLFAWKEALVIVRPETLYEHFPGLRICGCCPNWAVSVLGGQASAGTSASARDAA
jgi:hypothetical protein